MEDDMKDKILLSADTVNGVYRSTIELMLIGEDDFYASLSTLDDDSTITAYISEKMYKKIDAEYGIK
jgi:hypothetical protein